MLYSKSNGGIGHGQAQLTRNQPQPLNGTWGFDFLFRRQN